MCDPKATRAYCCTKPNWIGSSRLWNNRPRPHSLCLLAYIFAARKKIAGRYFRGVIFSREVIFARRYFRGKLFSREDIFAGRYFRVNSIFAKISSHENISNSLFAKISSRKIKCYTVFITDMDTALRRHNATVARERFYNRVVKRGV